MPALSNHRQETFCQLVKRRVPKRRAYVMAGYKPDDGAPYRLSANVRVKARMAELDRYTAMKTQVTVASITSELDSVRDGAAAAGQWAPARAAIETKAKLHGLLVERKETGMPGDFAALTPEAIIEKVRAELGDEAARLFQASLASSVEAETAPPLVPELTALSTGYYIN